MSQYAHTLYNLYMMEKSAKLVVQQNGAWLWLSGAPNFTFICRPLLISLCWEDCDLKSLSAVLIEPFVLFPHYTLIPRYLRLMETGGSA